MNMALSGLTLVIPKPNMLHIPSCKTNQQHVMIMLQLHHGIKTSRNIRHSVITCAAKKPGGGAHSGKGGQTNQLRSSAETSLVPKVSTLSASAMSSTSNSQNESQKSTKGEPNTTLNKTVATN